MSASLKTPLLNRSKVRQFTLLMAQNRARKFTRVSGEFCLRCEAHLKAYILDQVHRHPSIGKTLK